MRPQHVLATTALTWAACACVAPAQAAVLAADGAWVPFDVAFDLSGNLGWIDIADGSPLVFTFSVPVASVGTLTVVDGGFAGDRFRVTGNPGLTLGDTSAAVNSYPSSILLDFDAALANTNYSRGVFSLASGSYSVSGLLIASALGPAQSPLNSTVGGIRLSVAPVPEPGTLASMLAGLGLLATVLRRRAVR